jgi:PQQ-dependent catabolism-associated CXXCW motif protein
MMRRLGAAFALVLLSLPAFAETVPEPDGFRMEKYGAPVPATLAGARVVSTKEAEILWREGGAIFVDVLPLTPKPDLPEGTVWQEETRFDIPGSIWLPDVGYGALTPEVETWYRLSLETLVAGDKSRTLVIYCKADCWMSWNAAKRAVDWGFSGIVWYPGGTDEWKAAKLPLEERRPEPRSGEVSD